MAATKELLADILDGISVLQLFLRDLKKESLSQSCEKQRQNVSNLMDGVVNKIQNAHPSIRPRLNTPGKKPPAYPPPADKSHPPPPPPPVAPPPGTTIAEGEGEVYEEPPAEAAAAEDYLDFEPSPLNEDGEEPQEMYEAMQGEEQDVYEEPVNSTAPISQEDDDGPEEMYEEPVSSRPSTASLPMSRENSGSGAVYASTVVTPPVSEVEMSTDWGTVYTMPDKTEKTKVSALKNVAIKGYLEKLGGRNQKTWQRRYCVLSGALMYFYEKENSRTFNNFVVLLTFAVAPADNMTNEKKKQFAFKLTHTDTGTGKKKDYFFRTSSSEVREKWLNCIKKVLTSASPTSASPISPAAGKLSSATLPRMPLHNKTLAPADDGRKKRASSVGATGGLIEEDDQELYEDMNTTEQDQDEYVAVSPGADQEEHGLESSEEYVDVNPQEQVDQEEYEDTTNFQQQPPPPPPPASPPPGPPSELFTPSSVPAPVTTTQHHAPKAPAPPPPDPVVDTSRIYTQPGTNGIRLECVYALQWDFVASEADELELRRGDLVYVSNPQSSEEWWYGELLDQEASRKLGKAGFFPRTYSAIAFEPLNS